MVRRALEITGQGRHLHKDRGFLVISAERQEIGRLPLDDLEVVMFAGHGLTCTGELLNHLAERCVPVMLCDQRFLPSAVLWPAVSHAQQAMRIRGLANLSEPTRKRLWQQLVKAKILAQAEALLVCTGNSSPHLEQLARRVASGDATNVEGQAARVYWPRLFGADFRRDREQQGVNALLNYGYTVLRAVVARATMLAGLHPAFSLHHHNKNDTMPLVDDLIEPFRPLVDMLVYDINRHAGGWPALDTPAKQRLASLPTIDLIFEGATSPLSESLLRMTRSLAEVCTGERRSLSLPSGLKHRLSARDHE